MQYIEILGGLTSRLSILASLLDSELFFTHRIVWGKYTGCNIYFNELFQNNFGILNKENINFENINSIQTYGDSYGVYHYIPELLPENKKNIVVDNQFNFKNCDYTIMDWPINHEKEYNRQNTFPALKKLFKILVMIPELQRIYDEYLLKFSMNTIGINFRGCENTVNYNDGYSSYETFYEFILKLLTRNSKERIFISTGSQTFFDKISTISDDRIILIDELDLPIDAGYSISGVKRAMIEWLLLTKTNKAYISGGGYAIKACSIGNMEWSIM